MDIQTIELFDSKTVDLKLVDLRPAMQMRVQMRIRTKAGEPANHEIYHTINAMP